MITREPASPCISVCELSSAQICLGCGRSLDEIAAWSQASATQKLHIIDLARARLAEKNKEHA